MRFIGHTLYTGMTVKKTLSGYDNKRYLLSDDYRSLAYGHYNATELVPMEEVIERYHAKSMDSEKQAG